MPTLGFNPYSPIILLGILIEPPRSVPHPISDPHIERRAASPPVEPPGLKDGSRGLTVRPQSGLLVSATCFCQLPKKPKNEQSTYHNTLREVCLCDYDGAQSEHHAHYGGIFACRRERSANIPDCRVEALDIELIFERNRQSMEGPY